MKPSRRIKLPPSMTTDAMHRIFKTLQGRAKIPTLLFVGGCVRNALLGEEVNDIDLATVFTPEDVITKLKSAGIRAVPTGLDHGTITAVLGSETFQITTLRKDVETDGRRAIVSFSKDWHEDAQRRDFTLNTLLADEAGYIYDPLGEGLADLEKRKIIFVGNPEARIREDYLRILRFFRFQARYGKGRPDKKILCAILLLSKGLKTLSKERVTQEILKIISGPDLVQTISVMVDCKVLPVIFKAGFSANLFKSLEKVGKSKLINDNSKMEILGLLILAGFSKSGTARIEKNLCLSNFQKKQMDKALCSLKKFKTLTLHDLTLLLYKEDRATAELVLAARLILDQGSITTARRWFSILKDMKRPVLPLRGQDLIDQGMLPGPEIKKTLESFERSWIRNGFKDFS